MLDCEASRSTLRTHASVEMLPNLSLECDHGNHGPDGTGWPSHHAAETRLSCPPSTVVLNEPGVEIEAHELGRPL